MGDVWDTHDKLQMHVKRYFCVLLLLRSFRSTYDLTSIHLHFCCFFYLFHLFVINICSIFSLVKSFTLPLFVHLFLGFLNYAKPSTRSATPNGSECASNDAMDLCHEHGRSAVHLYIYILYVYINSVHTYIYNRYRHIQGQ